MKKIVALLALIGSNGAAHAAGNVHVTGIPNVASTNSGGSVSVDLWADWTGVVNGVQFAGFKFDIVGHANGTLVGAVNTDPFSGVNLGVNHGVPSGSNLLDMGGGRLPPGFDDWPINPIRLGTVTFTDAGLATENYTVTLSIIDYIPPAGSLHIFIGSSGTMSRSGLTSTTSTHTVTFEIGSFEVIVPTPASAVLLGLGGLAAGRRRR